MLRIEFLALVASFFHILYRRWGGGASGQWVLLKNTFNVSFRIDGNFDKNL